MNHPQHGFRHSPELGRVVGIILVTAGLFGVISPYLKWGSKFDYSISMVSPIAEAVWEWAPKAVWLLMVASGLLVLIGLTCAVQPNNVALLKSCGILVSALFVGFATGLVFGYSKLNKYGAEPQLGLWVLVAICVATLASAVLLLSRRRAHTRQVWPA